MPCQTIVNLTPTGTDLPCHAKLVPTVADLPYAGELENAGGRNLTFAYSFATPSGLSTENAELRHPDQSKSSHFRDFEWTWQGLRRKKSTTPAIHSLPRLQGSNEVLTQNRTEFCTFVRISNCPLTNVKEWAAENPRKYGGAVPIVPLLTPQKRHKSFLCNEMGSACFDV